MALIDKYSIEELQQIANISKSFTDFCYKLGYRSNATKTRNIIKQRILKNKINISHFSVSSNGIKRIEENTFIKNSTVNQSVLRRKYLKGEYSSYKCSICGQEPFWNGKELTLILDHINGNNTDDRLENLRWVCPNCNIQLETTNGKNKKQLQKKYYCIDCGKEITKNSKRCIDCNNKKRSVPLEQMILTREELKELIRNKSFSEIGRLYNVSDNAVRKWCDKYNLPRTKRDISSYSNEEWLKK